MLRLVAGITLVCVLAGCSKNTEPSAEKPSGPVNVLAPTPPAHTKREPNTADFTLTSDTLLKEWKADKKATNEKYGRKHIELIGPITYYRIESDQIPAHLGTDSRAGSDANEGDDESKVWLVFGGSEAKKYPGLRATSRGQRITVRGVYNASSSISPQLDDVQLIEVGATTARGLRLAELEAALKDPTKQKETMKVDVVVRVRVKEVGPDKAFYPWVVTDADDPKGVEFLLAPGRPNPVVSEEVAALKPGDVVVVIGRPEPASGPIEKPSLQHTCILKELPVGVKLLAEKK